MQEETSALIEYTESLATQVQRAIFPDILAQPQAQDRLFVKLFGTKALVQALEGDEEYVFYHASKSSTKQNGKSKKRKVLKPATLKQGRPLRPTETVLSRASLEAMHFKIKEGIFSDSDSEDGNLSQSTKRRKRDSVGEEKSIEDLASTFSGVDVA